MRFTICNNANVSASISNSSAWEAAMKASQNRIETGQNEAEIRPLLPHHHTFHAVICAVSDLFPVAFTPVLARITADKACCLHYIASHDQRIVASSAILARGGRLQPCPPIPPAESRSARRGEEQVSPPHPFKKNRQLPVYSMNPGKYPWHYVFAWLMASQYGYNNGRIAAGGSFLPYDRGALEGRIVFSYRWMAGFAGLLLAFPAFPG